MASGRSHSLHVGVGDLKLGTRPLADARRLGGFAVQQGFQHTRFLLSPPAGDPEPGAAPATVANFLTELERAAEALRGGGDLLLSFSGHGQLGLVGDITQNRWIFADGYLADEDFFDQLCRFPEGVRIVVLSDACNSGTIVLPHWLSHPALSDRCGPDVIQLSACLDEQTAAQFPGESGAFTHAFFEVLRGGIPATYPALFDAVKQMMRALFGQGLPQEPGYVLLGKTREGLRAFEKSRPFDLGHAAMQAAPMVTK